MEDQDIKKLRADVIEKFINLEILVSAIITQHYFHKVDKNFLYQVLYDEYFNFGIKLNILLKIIERPDNKVINKLRRLSKIRNTFAHSGLLITKVASGRQFYLDTRKLDNEIDFQELFEEFCEFENPVLNYLLKVFKEKGGPPLLTEDEHKNLLQKKESE